MSAKRILIVDFDAESLIALSNLVYEEGFQVETASDGLAAYEKFKSGNFDLVVLEPMLPKLHGFELCKKIAADPQRRIPVIIVTAIYREPSCRVEALNVHGAAAFFIKPYNKEELRAKILQLLVESKPPSSVKHDAPEAPTAHAPQRPAVQASPSASSAALSAALRGSMADIMGAKAAKPINREPKPARTFADIEKELQEVVSEIVPPVKKKEPVVPREFPSPALREEPRAAKINKEFKPASEPDIDVLLKGAIEGLTPAPKKRVPEAQTPEIKIASAPKASPSEPLVRPAPAPVPPAKPSPRPDKFKVAPEIREGISFIPPKPNNTAHAAVRLAAEKQNAPFGIDQTLIEIDKIPIDIVKPSPQEVRVAEAQRAFEKKRGLFEEYGEPAKKGTNFAVIGGVVCGLVIAASALFFVLKSKKPGQPAADLTAATRQEAQAQPVSLGSAVKAYPDAQEAELKPEPRKPPAKPADQPPVDIGAPIMTVQPSDGAPVHIQEQPVESNAGAVKATNPSPAQQPVPAAATPATEPQSKAGLPPADPGQAQEAPDAVKGKAKEGSLVPLDKVDSHPVLVKRVDPKYPPLALRSGVSGTVTVNALISEKGDVLRTEILKGVKDGFGLEAAAEAALRQWKFRAARKDGASVKVWKSFDINFKANTKSS